MKLVFSTRQALNAGRIGEYLDLKISAALVPQMLEQIFQGERVQIGELVMDADGLACGAAVLRWSQVAGVRVDASMVRIDHVNYTGWVRLPPHRVLFPTVAQAIVRILTEENLTA